jgi:hypothetical protein
MEEADERAPLVTLKRCLSGKTTSLLVTLSALRMHVNYIVRKVMYAREEKQLVELRLANQFAGCRSWLGCAHSP